MPVRVGPAPYLLHHYVNDARVMIVPKFHEVRDFVFHPRLPRNLLMSGERLHRDYISKRDVKATP